MSPSCFLCWTQSRRSAAASAVLAADPTHSSLTGYDHDIYRDQVRDRGIVPVIARRNTRHGTGLGTYRWVVERTFAWLHGFRRLCIRWERRADIHEAFLRLACCLISYRQLGLLR